MTTSERPRRPSRGTRAGRAVLRAGRATGHAGRATGRRIRAATNAQGAGESGLGRLIELHGVNMAGDTLVTVALAGTLFFAVPVGEARGRVALYLLVTMAPFVLVAPVVGPLLDRLRHGRRWALATTFAVRAALAWVMALAVTGGQDAARLYPAAFGLLVMSKAYGITRAAMVPRVLPPRIELVKANSRISLAGSITTGLAAGVGAGLAWFGPPWPLRLAVVVYAVGAWVSLTLPRRADSAAGEEASRISAEPEPDARPAMRNVGPAVVMALRANAALRAFSGFLILFLAFVLRTDPFGSMPVNVVIGLAAVAAAVGGFLGITVGALLKARPPEAITVAVLGVATLTCALGAWLYALWAVLLVAAGAGLAQTTGSLALDAMIQREVPERWRTSAFGRSETLLQLAWVVGGAIGIVTPLRGAAGLAVAAGLLALALVVTLRSQQRLRRAPTTAR